MPLSNTKTSKTSIYIVHCNDLETNNETKFEESQQIRNKQVYAAVIG
jgi:hypothetical protein